MGEPACLPDFKGLAQQIAVRAYRAYDGKMPIDRYLGELYHQHGVEIYDLAAKELSGDDLMYTELHMSLLRIFPRTEDIRVATTNFDLLFEKAASADNEFADQEIERFRAPALPLGSSFNGIVHVHGSVVRPMQMTLTYSDFGRAYLTEGWARSFMMGLHSSYTILFVGYSHQDMILNYLVRALPSDENKQQHFALAIRDADDLRHKETEDHWKWLGIRPIFYPPSRKSDEHEKLTEGVKELADFVNRRISEWKEIIEQQLQRSPNNLDKKELSHIEYAINVDELAELIWMTAASPGWYEWLVEKGYVERRMFNERD